jgi:hypothetical protein
MKSIWNENRRVFANFCISTTTHWCIVNEVKSIPTILTFAINSFHESSFLLSQISPIIEKWKAARWIWRTLIWCSIYLLANSHKHTNSSCKLKSTCARSTITNLSHEKAFAAKNSKHTCACTQTHERIIDNPWWPF